MTRPTPNRLEPSAEVRTQEIDGEIVLLDLASERFFTLNEVGARIWQLVGEHTEPAVVFEKMLEEFEVEPETLKEDMDSLLAELVEAGLLRTVPEENDA